MRARAPAALAAGTALAALLPLVPAAASAQLPYPELAAEQMLTSPQVRPSTCPGRDESLAFSRRPTFTLTTRTAVAAGTRLQVEVYPAGTAPHHDFVGDLRPEATGTAGPVAPGSRTYAWRPTRPLPADGHDWRVRLVRDGRAVTRWSGWGSFVVDPAFPRLRTCRFTGPELQAAAAYAKEQGWSLERQLADDAWRQDFHRLAARLARTHPAAFAAAETVNAHLRRGWVAFRRDGVPRAARAALARFRAAHPGSSVEVLTGRNYTGRMLQRRADAIADHAVASRIVDPYDLLAEVRLRTGTIILHVPAYGQLGLTDAQVRARVRRAIEARVSGYALVAPGPAVLAGPARQPFRLVVHRDT